MKLQQKLTLALLRSRIAILSKLSKKKAASLAFDIFCTTTGKRNYEPTAFYAEAESLSFQHNTINIKGYRWNKGAAKKILIAHGFSSSAINFGHFAKRLVSEGYEVFAFDGPAHGNSGGKRTNALEYKNFISALIKRYDGFNAFLAHSFGGLATCMAVAELASTENIKIALIAPASKTETLLKIYFEQLKIKDEKVQQLIVAKIKSISGKEPDWFSIKRCMPFIKGPVLWVHDKNDKVTPVKDALEAEQLQYPNINFLFTQDLGHRRIYRDENIVNKVIDFLK